MSGTISGLTLVFRGGLGLLLAVCWVLVLVRFSNISLIVLTDVVVVGSPGLGFVLGVLGVLVSLFTVGLCLGLGVVTLVVTLVVLGVVGVPCLVVLVNRL